MNLGVIPSIRGSTETTLRARLRAYPKMHP
ncbi:hypothetical protein SRABI83_00825 [Arthrobacter sp. Bi83]|nr:hypothetical protein SRABI83_00825 [Arthrobacter sp. Bi83]